MIAAMLIVAALDVRSVRLQADLVRLKPDTTYEQEQPTEVVASVRVHGNVLTPEADVLQIAGISAGLPIGPDTLRDVEARLRASKRFERVEVLKRFASIADPSAILVVIVVDEGPVRIEETGDPTQPVRVVRNRRARVMVLPLLDVEDGYGLSYGARFTVPEVAGRGSRLSFPMTWGGNKRAAAEISKDFDRGPMTRGEAGASISRRTNPFFRETDERGRLWVRGERLLTRSIRAGVTADWQHVSFFGRSDRVAQIGADLVLDTRLDPALPRNAMYGRIGWSHAAIAKGNSPNRLSLDGRVYIGLVGQSVLALRAQHDTADASLPSYLQPLLGGVANVRGLKAGSAVGDDLAAGSIELRVPLTSPLNIGKIGVSTFIDAGTVYNRGQRLTEQNFDKGVGGSLWFSAAVFRRALLSRTALAARLEFTSRPRSLSDSSSAILTQGTNSARSPAICRFWLGV